jgi:hypothetical protein
MNPAEDSPLTVGSDAVCACEVKLVANRVGWKDAEDSYGSINLNGKVDKQRSYEWNVYESKIAEVRYHGLLGGRKSGGRVLLVCSQFPSLRGHTIPPVRFVSWIV